MRGCGPIGCMCPHIGGVQVGVRARVGVGQLTVRIRGCASGGACTRAYLGHRIARPFLGLTLILRRGKFVSPP